MEPDELVPDSKVAKEFGRSLITFYRWDRDPNKAALGWPPPVKIGQRNYRSRKMLEEFKARLIKTALAEPPHLHNQTE